MPRQIDYNPYSVLEQKAPEARKVPLPLISFFAGGTWSQALLIVFHLFFNLELLDTSRYPYRYLRLQTKLTVFKKNDFQEYRYE